MKIKKSELEHVCEHCGLAFTGRLHRGQRRFCSLKCTGQSRKRGDGVRDGMTRLYKIWQHMIDRCHNPKSKDYRRYGARGIHVFDDWREFSRFKDWAMASGYRDGLEVDRIRGHLGYGPENCRWATRHQQMSNTFKYSGRNGIKPSSAFKGVCSRNAGRFWMTRVRKEGRLVFCGQFKTELEAALAYDDAAFEAFGEFACLNFPERKRGFVSS